MGGNYIQELGFWGRIHRRAGEKERRRCLIAMKGCGCQNCEEIAEHPRPRGNGRRRGKKEGGETGRSLLDSRGGEWYPFEKTAESVAKYDPEGWRGVDRDLKKRVEPRLVLSVVGSADERQG